nr:molybdopterin cofactor-binding domain-containing protein [Alkaliphilus metalliredigens]
MKYEIVGKRAIRVDGRSKVTGQATYPEDLQMEGMCYGRTLRSEKPHAYFTLNTEKAEAIEGVLCILTSKDVPHNHHGVLLKDHEVFCAHKVRRVGDPMAFVVAENEKVAEQAMEAIEVSYEELQGVFDPEEAMADSAPQVHDKSNVIYHYKIRRGDIQEAFKQCHVVVEGEYRTDMVDHAFLQPESGIAYTEEDGTIVICVANQYPHFDQLEVAEALEVELDTIRIINPAVGGAFGGREDITLQIHLALATQRVGRPVKATYSREESFDAHSKRHGMKMKYRTGADQQGKLLAMEATVIGDTGAYASWAINVARKAGVHATGPYEIPNVKVDSYAVYTNNPFAGAMRGFGAAQTPIAHEQQIDEIGVKLGIDPITMRVINGFKTGSETATGQILEESAPFEECLRAVEEALRSYQGPGEGQ